MEQVKKGYRLGDVLVERGSLSVKDLRRAIQMQKDQEKNMRMGEILLQNHLVSKTEVGLAMEQLQNIPYAECPPPSVDPAVLELVPQSTAMRCCALPLEVTDRKLIIAMAEPQNLAFLDELRFSVGMTISPRFSFRDDILSGIKQFYGDIESKDSVQDLVATEAGSLDLDDDATKDIEFIVWDADVEGSEAKEELHAGRIRPTAAVRFLSAIINAAVQKSASDIHIEPRADFTVIRARVDGILRELMTMPSEHHASLVSRIKILCNMDISERRLPQDGRFMIQHRGRRLDMRSSSLPTHFGEKVVMRVLDPNSSLITLDQLGFSEGLGNQLREILARPQGMLLVTGPTGSGKSTTLYGSLNVVRSPNVNIVTVEDPVEFMLDGVNQVQVHSKVGLTFATCLPSILRQDPDVIMVGEIRNVETAEIVMHASQTGHLVLSTLHTNDSIGAITRLLDLGVPSYLIAESVTAIVAQRLARRFCSCRRKVHASPDYIRKLQKLGAPNTDTFQFEYQSVGCSLCDNIGYKGRVGIYEMLAIKDAVRDAIHDNARTQDILRLARKAGFQTMQEDALEKLKTGLTSLDELQRVVPWDMFNSSRCPSCSTRISANESHCSSCGSTFVSDDLPETAGVLHI